MDNDGYFEIALRLMGTEVIGFRIGAEDMKVKWIVAGLLTLTGVAAIASYFGLLTSA